MQQEPPIPTTRSFPDQASRDSADKEFMVYDPAEGMNKEIYKFNAEFDDYIFLPVVNAYTFITPKFARTGVSNFFLNIGEVNNFANSVLQANPKKAYITLWRFAINSTVGLLGTFDVATHMGLNRQQEDFGKTLGHWGSGAGAYIMLPLLGPSNVRDTVGKIVDYGTFAYIIPEHVQNSRPYEVVAYGLRAVDLRYSNDFRYYSSGSPFEYELVRYVYTQLRTTQIEKEKKE
jgi:phospholipid-binding lipoprotein MlaA